MTKLPRSIALVITNKCNLRCKICFQYGEAAKKDGIKSNALMPNLKELNYAQVIKTIDNINKNYPLGGKPHIYITGGEPFARKDMTKIIGYIHSQGNELVISSNFYLVTKDDLSKLAKLDNLLFSVSLDGTQRIHDQIRGVKGLYKKALSNIKYLSSRGRMVKVHCTISKDNFDCLVGLYKDLSKFKNVSLCLGNIFWIDDKHRKVHKQMTKFHFGKEETIFLSDNLVVPNSKIKELEKQFKKIYKLSEKNGLPIFQSCARDEGLRDYYKKFSCKLRNKICRKHGLTILPDGNVKYCTGVTYGVGPVLGNFLKNSMDHILKNRKKIDKVIETNFEKGLVFPVCAKCCFLKDKNEETYVTRFRRTANRIFFNKIIFPDGVVPYPEN